MSLFLFKNNPDLHNVIEKTIYSDISDTDGINLRQEMIDILYGTPYSKPKGHWVIYRRYITGEFSTSYNPRTKEGVNGPAFNYKDELIRVRWSPTGKKHEQTEELKVTTEPNDKYTYYLDYTVKPKIGDNIYELDLDDHTNKPSTIILSYKYTILRTLDYRMENGNIQYYSVITKRDEVNY
jgi:hypothetical protein